MGNNKLTSPYRGVPAWLLNGGWQITTSMKAASTFGHKLENLLAGFMCVYGSGFQSGLLGPTRGPVQFPPWDTKKTSKPNISLILFIYFFQQILHYLAGTKEIFDYRNIKQHKVNAEKTIHLKKMITLKLLIR